LILTENKSKDSTPATKAISLNVYLDTQHHELALINRLMICLSKCYLLMSGSALQTLVEEKVLHENIKALIHH